VIAFHIIVGFFKENGFPSVVTCFLTSVDPLCTPLCTVGRACATNVPLIWFNDELLRVYPHHKSSPLSANLPSAYPIVGIFTRNSCGPRDCFHIYGGKFNKRGWRGTVRIPRRQRQTFCTPNSTCSMHNLRVMRIAYFTYCMRARCPRCPFWHLQL